MSAEEHNAIESQWQALLGQLKAAEAALRAGMHTHGFGSIARAHMERALAHISEAHIALNEPKHARSVHQLVDDLNRIQQVTDGIKRRQHNSPRV
jgi:DNA-binding transcriptional regulator PaaX